MGFLGDLFASKGTVEVRTSITGIPPGVNRLYKLAFVESRPGAGPPRSMEGARWTGLTEDPEVSRSLPAGYWQVQVLANPSRDGSKPDPTRAIVFWPLEKAFEVKKGETVKLRLDVAVPRAGLDGI